MRLYTVAEAAALLPQVIPMLEQLRTAFVALRALRAAVAAESRGASGDGNLLADPWAGGDAKDRAEALNAALRGAAAQLESWGIELKDPERGLIDFYHDRMGEVVYLCFLLGEGSLGYWHTLDGGFAGRQSL